MEPGWSLGYFRLGGEGGREGGREERETVYIVFTCCVSTDYTAHMYVRMYVLSKHCAGLC